MIPNSHIHKKFYGVIYLLQENFKGTFFLECGNYTIKVDSGLTPGVRFQDVVI
jgi:hypothetical protein